MMAKTSLFLLAAIGLFLVETRAQAQDPFAFQFGYVLGYQNSFRNRLPTPPYFAVYPPVYYGARYQRPYGDSPFAAFPQLRSAADYAPVRADGGYRTRSVSNPHYESMPSPSIHKTVGEPVAASRPTSGGITTIINPFALPQLVHAPAHKRD